MGMQLAVNVQLPKALGGLSGGVIYIDTEGSFIPARFRQMAHHAREHGQKLLEKAGQAYENTKKQFSEMSDDTFLENCSFY
eukprot:gene2422-13294_t